MPTVNVAMDASSVVIAAEQMTRSIASITSGVKTAALESAKYGKAGELLSGTMRGVDTEGRKFTATLKTMQGVLGVNSVKFEELNKTVKQSINHFAEITKAVNDISNMFQRFVGYKALNAMNEALKEGFTAAKEFQVQISLIRTISQDNQLSFGSWAKSIKEVSDQTGFGIADTTKAAYDAISNQVAKGNSVFGFLKDAGDLARVNLGGTLEQSVNLLSSAINAYGKSAGDARELSALFFATIDEGRVTMEDMADTFGRVAILAKGLDIPIQELTASIAFLTQKGVTTDDAFTFMRNVFVQLEKPSAQLAAFFKSIGVESGQAAIRTYGFMGILKKIKDEVAGGNLEVAKLFPEIRAQQPIQAALNDFEGYQRIADKFGNTAKLIQDYQKAIDIRAESPADFINKEFNKIKNTFVVDIGQKLINLSKDILVSFQFLSRFFTGQDSLSAGLNLLLITVRDLTIAIVAYRTGTAIATGVTAGWSAAMAAAGANATKTTVAVTLLNRAVSASIVGLIAAAAAVVASKLVFSNDLLAGPRLFEGMADDAKKLREEAIKLAAVDIKSPFQKLQEDNKKAFQDTLQGLAKLTVETTANLDKMKSASKESADAFKNAFQTYTDSLKSNVNELSKKVTEAETVIKRSQKGALNFKDTLNKVVDDVRLQNLVGENKIAFLNNQTTTLLQRAQEAYASGNNDQIAEADRLVEEAKSSIKARFDAEQELFKQRREAFENANPQERKFTDVDYKNHALEDSKRLEEDLNKLYYLRKNLVGDVVVAKQKEIDKTKEAIAAGKLQIRDVEDQFKKFNEFSPFDAGGNLKKEYKNQVTGRANIGKAKEDFDKYADQLRASVANSGDVAARLQVEQTIANRRKELIAEIGAAEQAEIVSAASKRAIEAQKDYENSLENNKKKLSAAAATQKGLLDKAGDLGGDITGLADVGTDYKRRDLYGFSLPGALSGAKRGFDTKEFNENKARMDALKQAVKDYNIILASTKRQLDVVNGQPVAKPENVTALLTASANLRAKLRGAFQPLTGSNYGNAIIPGTTDLTFSDFELALQDKENKLRNVTGVIGQTGTRDDLLQQQFDQTIKPSLDALKGILPASVKELDEATKQTTTSFGAATSSAYQLAEATNILKTNFNAFFAKQPEANIGGTGKPYTGSEPIERALGGWIGRPSASIGPDKYNMKAGDGEFMVNAESASMYPDTLMAINKARRGSVPSILGGNVSSTKVGDIYITVNESQDGQQTSRQVWNKLRREMRRGNIT